MILDFATPEMHGLDAATAIKFILPRARIYLLTAHSSRDLELAARNGGVDAVFSKYDNLTAMFKQAKVGRIFKTPTKATRSPRASNAVQIPLPTAKAAFIDPTWSLQTSLASTRQDTNEAPDSRSDFFF